MTPTQILSIAGAVNGWAEVGIQVVGGVKSLLSILHAPPTDDELNAVEAAIAADATRRANERGGTTNS